MSSMGTATTPQRAHPKKAATHSAQLGVHSSTVSPFEMWRDLQLACKLVSEDRHLSIGPALATISPQENIGAFSEPQPSKSSTDQAHLPAHHV